MKGKLLLLVNWKVSQDWQQKIKKQFPDLEISSAEITDKVPVEPADDIWENAVAALCDKACFKWKAFAPDGPARNLKYVQLISAGADPIKDVQLFRDGSVPFCTANGVHPPQIAEWVIATYLAHLHRLPEYLRHQSQNLWQESEDDEDGEDALSRTMGILGYGSIGRQVAVLGKALGMKIHAHTLRPRDSKESRKDDSYCLESIGDPEGLIPAKWSHGASSKDINAFIEDLDVLVICMPLTAQTNGMIGTKEFETMSRKKAFVSNIGRGKIINTDALIDALDRKLISGAALDVTDPEPLPESSKLWQMESCIITPHVSGNSKQYNARVLDIVKTNLERLDAEKPLVNLVDRERGY